MKQIYIDLPIKNLNLLGKYYQYIIEKASENVPEILPEIDKKLTKYIDTRFGKDWRDLLKKYNQSEVILLDSVYISPKYTRSLNFPIGLYSGYVSKERFPRINLPKSLVTWIEDEWIKVLREREVVFIESEKLMNSKVLFDEEKTTLRDIKSCHPDFYQWYIQDCLRYSDQVKEVTLEEDLKLLTLCLPDTTLISQEQQEEAQEKE